MPQNFGYNPPEHFLIHVAYEWNEPKMGAIEGHLFKSEWEALKFLSEESLEHDLENVVVTKIHLRDDNEKLIWNPPSSGSFTHVERED